MRIYPPKHHKDEKASTFMTTNKYSSTIKTKKKVSRRSASGIRLERVYFDQNFCLDYSSTAFGENRFTPSTVIQRDKSNNLMTVRLSTGDIFQFPDNSLVKVEPQDEEGVDDITTLAVLSEMSVLHTIRVRFLRNDYYTFAGPLLVSLNSYMVSPEQFTDEDILRHHFEDMQKLKMPHIFDIANAAYVGLMTELASPRSTGTVRNQCIVISGCSGSGKTEAAKLVLKFLTRVSVYASEAEEEMTERLRASAFSSGMAAVELEESVIGGLSLLEPFGNARSALNDNSSRFGKLVRVRVGADGKIRGVRVERLLLLSSRLISRPAGERCFHIFHQLLRGGGTDALGDIPLGRAEDHRFLRGPAESASALADNSEAGWEGDRSLFSSSCRWLETALRGSGANHIQVLRAVAGILLVGELSFLEDGDGTATAVDPRTQQYWESVCALLGLTADDLLHAMTRRVVHIGGASVVKAQSRLQAVERCDAFAKAVYTLLFEWLVERVNIYLAASAFFSSHSTNPQTESGSEGWIGILDLYGFEDVEPCNGFEQLLINYAEERLQQHFTKHVFQVDQAEYLSEAIDWDYIAFADNGPCVELMDGRPDNRPGIFHSLDDYGCGKVNSESGFLAQLHGTWSGQHQSYLTPRFNSDKRFGITHYAGEVHYQVSSFLEQNKGGAVAGEMRELILKSSDPVLRLATEATGSESRLGGAGGPAHAKSPTRQKLTPSSSRGGYSAQSHSFHIGHQHAVVTKAKEESVSMQFVTSLGRLLEGVDHCKQHFVRCISPNKHKKPGIFDTEYILKQMQCSGLIGAALMARQGYSLRQLHKDFFREFRVLRPGCVTLRQLLEVLSVDMDLATDMWQLGTTKVFCKEEMAHRLERWLYCRRSAAVRVIERFFHKTLLTLAATRIQAWVRRRLSQTAYKRFQRGLLRLQAIARGLHSRTVFRRSLKAVTLIQSLYRMHATRLRVFRSSNRFEGKSRQELKFLKRELKLRWRNNSQSKSYLKLAKLQISLEQIRVALLSAPLPTYAPPRSRGDLDRQIAILELELENIQTSMVLHLESAIRNRIQTLKKLIAAFPSIGDLDAEALRLGEQLTQAISRKDFRMCGEIQKALLRVEEKKGKEMKENFLFYSAADFDERIRTLESGVEKQIADKDFNEAFELQTELLEVRVISSAIRPTDPVETRIRSIETQTDAALSMEDFDLAARLQVASRQLASSSIPAVFHSPSPGSEEKIMHGPGSSTRSPQGVGAAADFTVNTKATALQHLESTSPVPTAVSIPQTAVAANETVSSDVLIPPVGKWGHQYSEMSTEELLVELHEVREGIQVGVRAKEFLSCEVLNEKLGCLEAVLACRTDKEDLTGSLVRSRLQNLLKALEEAVAARDFKLCDTLNKDIQKYQQLLKVLPTADELQVEIMKLEAEQVTALNSKHYTECDRLEKLLVSMRAEYNALAEMSPQTALVDTGASQSLAQSRELIADRQEVDKETRGAIYPPSPYTSRHGQVKVNGPIVASSTPIVSVSSTSRTDTAPTGKNKPTEQHPTARISRHEDDGMSSTSKASVMPVRAMVSASKGKGKEGDGAGGVTSRPVSQLRPRVPVVEKDSLRCTS